MRFDVITIFPEMFTALTQSGITRRACKSGLVSCNTWQLRDYTTNAYRKVDDKPYGGGAGMVMKPEPIEKAIQDVQQHQKSIFKNKGICIYPNASGSRVTAKDIKRWRSASSLTFLCGRYEGVDQRVIDLYVDEIVSVGDIVVSGGELPAMILMDAIIRTLPGAISFQSHDEESFMNCISANADLVEEDNTMQLLEYPQYTRPEIFAGVKVPKVLLSGNHSEIKKWRAEMAYKLTNKNRPELLIQ